MPLSSRRSSSFWFAVSVLLLSAASTALAFVVVVGPQSTAITIKPQPPHSAVWLRSSNSKNTLPSLQDLNLDSLQKYLPNFANLWDARESVWNNVVDGELGQRGEAFTAAQLFALACIALGGVPLVGGVVSLVCVPVLLLLGVAVVVASATELGPSFSPWPVPSKETNKIAQTGLFGLVRHPNYAGLLAACLGFAVVTNDANRLLLTAVLWYILEIKTDAEEKELRAVFPQEYDQYKEKVTGKFVPNQLLEMLPWSAGKKMD